MKSSPALSSRYAIVILAAMHFFGLIAFLLIDLERFVVYSPLTLLLSALIVFLAHPGRQKSLLIFFLLSYTLGFVAELSGVLTGFPFGDYRYGESLGWKWQGVPWLIGVNWFLIALAGRSVFEPLRMSPWLKTALAASAMTALDFLIEPLSAQLDYWYWRDNQIPIENFLGWWAVSFIIQYVGYFHISLNRNLAAASYYVIVALFFGILNLGLWSGIGAF